MRRICICLITVVLEAGPTLGKRHALLASREVRIGGISDGRAYLIAYQIYPTSHLIMQT